jgi:NitT/TauT family transport system substrate-binding protein
MAVQWHGGHVAIQSRTLRLDAVKKATAIIATDPKGTAQSWINDSSSKLALEMVTKVVTGPGVEWTMTPAATMKFAKFMRRVGTIKREPASWKDMFFSEIGGLNGS